MSIKGKLVYKGGPGSGHHGHGGRPGKRGGSLPGGSGGKGSGGSSQSIYSTLEGSPSDKADKILTIGYNHKVDQFSDTLDEIHRIGDVPIMTALDKQWLQILNSPGAMLPGDAIISKLQSKGYGDKFRITVESRKKYGS